jgi:RNA polymerase sigma factor (sigma-70 family)
MTIVSMQTRRDALEKKGRPDGLLRDASRQIPRHDDDSQVASGDMAGDDDDSARFGRLVLPYLGDAYSLARWITGNRTDAEDVVQEASLRAFRAIGSVADGNSRAWVLTIVRNTAYTWMRKNRPAAVMVVEDLEAVEAAQVDAGAPHDGTPEAELIAKADAASLEAAIADLPTAYRETLILRDVQGLTYREISEVTGVPIGTVMSRLARGRNRVIKTIGRKTS